MALQHRDLRKQAGAADIGVIQQIALAVLVQVDQGVVVAAVLGDIVRFAGGARAVGLQRVPLGIGDAGRLRGWRRLGGSSSGSGLAMSKLCPRVSAWRFITVSIGVGSLAGAAAMSRRNWSSTCVSDSLGTLCASACGTAAAKAISTPPMPSKQRRRDVWCDVVAALSTVASHAARRVSLTRYASTAATVPECPQIPGSRHGARRAGSPGSSGIRR